MILADLLEKAPPKVEGKGTYAAVRFSDETKDAIAAYIKDNDLPNPLGKDKMHCTLLYSRKHCPDYKPAGKIKPAWLGKPTGLEVFESRGKMRDEEPKRCLVLRFECKQLVARHELLMEEYDATYDFPEYKPHVTLSYDIGDLDETELPDVVKAIKELEIVDEYGEDLDMDWAAKNAKSEDD